jgi:hypothetical protein
MEVFMKKVLSKAYRLALLAATLVLFLFSCANPVTDNSFVADIGSKSITGTNPLSFPLYAGQTTNVGSVVLTQDADNLYLAFQLASGVTLNETHVWIGSQPIDTKGRPDPGQYDKDGKPEYVTNRFFGSQINDNGIVTVPLTSAIREASSLYIYAHATVTIANGSNETAFSGLTLIPGAGGWYYMIEGITLADVPVVPSPSTQRYSISGFVFRDLNADGVKNGETGLPGVVLSLSNGFTATSRSDGYYIFSDLPAGTYTLSSGGLTGHYATPYESPVTTKTLTVGPSITDINFGLSYESIKSIVYYDANGNKTYDSGEPLLEGFNVSLNNGALFSTNAGGTYLFDHLAGKTTYTVTAADKEGFLHSGPATLSVVTPASSIPAVAYFGFVLDYSWIPGKLANGFTIGYWKTNLDKAISGKTNGIQVSVAKLQAYVNALSNFALTPLNVNSMKEASDKLSATGSSPTLLLAKQLMGSEFNYASGAYIGGNELVTRFFLYEGEYMLENSGSFTSAQLLAQKDRYDAYNNSHGGAVLF